MGISEDMTRLVQDGQRCQRQLNPYATDLVQSIQRNMRSLHQNLANGFISNNDEISNSLSQNNQVNSLERNNNLNLNNQNTINENNENNTLSTSMQTQITKKKKNKSLTQSSIRNSLKNYDMQGNVHFNFLGHRLQLSTLHRMKRCLFIYHKLRLDILKGWVWKLKHLPTDQQVDPKLFHNDRYRTLIKLRKCKVKAEFFKKKENKEQKLTEDFNLNSKEIDNNINNNSVTKLFCNNEIKYGLNYQDLLLKTSNSMPMVDLLGSIEPPKDFLVRIKVVKDLGMIVLEGGILEFKMGSILVVRKKEILKFLVRGDVILI